MTLQHYADVEQLAFKKYVIRQILREVRLAELLPWDSVDSLQNIAIRWKTLPSVAFRYVNGGYTANEGDTEQVTESVYAFGGEILYDRVFDKLKNVVQEPKKVQTDMKLLAMALKFNDVLINGDQATDPLSFEGLKKRVAGMPTRQSVYFAGSSSAALDPTASVANANVFFSKLEEVHYKTNRGQVGALLMNEGMIYGLGRVARYVNASGGMFLALTKDSFDRDIMTYKGARCIDVGMQRDQSTEIITDTETAGDAGADATSIYGMSFDEQQGIRGIQLSPMEVYDPLNGGEMESTPQKKVRIEWWCGLATYGSFGVVRGRNVEGASQW
jgi:hypothetical protein